MTVLELLTLLTEQAKVFRKEHTHYSRNKHMHDITECPEQEVIDAVLVGFINHIASNQGGDYGLRTVHLKHNADDIGYHPAPESVAEMSEQDNGVSLSRLSALLTAWDDRIERLEADKRKHRDWCNKERAIFVEGQSAGYTACYRDLQIAVAASRIDTQGSKT